MGVFLAAEHRHHLRRSKPPPKPFRREIASVFRPHSRTRPTNRVQHAAVRPQVPSTPLLVLCIDFPARRRHHPADLRRTPHVQVLFIVLTNRFLTQRLTDPTGQRSEPSRTPARLGFESPWARSALFYFSVSLTGWPHRSVSHASPQPSQPADRIFDRFF